MKEKIKVQILHSIYKFLTRKNANLLMWHKKVIKGQTLVGKTPWTVSILPAFIEMLLNTQFHYEKVTRFLL